jgi:STE24 endopeptidase
VAPTRAELAARYFSPQEIERSRRYHRPLYLVGGASAALSLGLLAVLTFTDAGDALVRVVTSPLAHQAAGTTAIAVVVLLSIARLPLSAWTGHVHERRWGFSTQRFGGWLKDWAKALAVRAVLAGFVFVLLFAIVERTEAWPLIAAPGAALVVAVMAYVAPVVLEPLFNRFEPLRDEQLAEDLRALSVQAGVPVRDVLVADASRRTKKENAYVSGLGATRRVVVYDTLLARGSDREVGLVVAHELGHRRARHVALGTALAAFGAAAGVLILWLAVRSPGLRGAVGATSVTDPRLVPAIMLGVRVLGLATAPIGTRISRRWERAADRASIQLTADPAGFADMERNLAVANLSELAPSRLAYAFLFTHPTPGERIAAAIDQDGSALEPSGATE